MFVIYFILPHQQIYHFKLQLSIAQHIIIYNNYLPQSVL